MIIHQKLWYSIIMKLCFGLYSWLFSIFKCFKSRICYKNVTETWIRDACENAKMCIAMKMVRVFVKKYKTSHSSEFRIEINNNICRCRNADKFDGNSFSINICTIHRISSKNVYHNICAHTWHSESVMGCTCCTCIVIKQKSCFLSMLRFLT